MTAFHCAIVGVLVLAAGLLAVHRGDPQSKWVKGVRELNLYACIFVVVAIAFSLTSHFLSSSSLDTSTISSVLNLEKQVVWLQSVSKPLLKLNFWAQISILALIAILALAGAAAASSLLASANRWYGKGARLAFLTLFFISSFSFFQSKLASETGEVIAQLKAQTGEILALNRRAADAVEAAVVSRIVDEVAASEDMSETYRTVVSFWKLRDDWTRENPS